MAVPIPVGRVGQLVKGVEDCELHVGLNPVDQPDPTVAEVEDDGILVGNPGRSNHGPRVVVELELTVAVPQPLAADSPRLAAPRCRQVGVGHDDVTGPVAPHPMNPRVLVRPDTCGRGGGESPLEVIGHPVGGVEHEHIGDVVEKARPLTRIPPIPLTHTSSEQAEGAILVDQAGVEDRSVSGGGSGPDDGGIGDPDGCVCWHEGRHVHPRSANNVAFAVLPRESV